MDLGVEAPSMRIATPAVGIVHLFKLRELHEANFSVGWRPSRACFHFGFDTLGGVLSGDSARPDDPGDIYSSAHGYLCFTVRRVKRGTAHIQAFVKTIAPPPQSNTLRTIDDLGAVA